MAPSLSLQDLIETIRRDAGSDDPLELLATASSTVNDVSAVSDAALGYFVDQARASGRSWVEISKVLGVTKQAVHKRFSAVSKQTLERFTHRARRVLDAASDVATRAGHHHVGTEHLLLAQFTEPEGVAATVLAEAGITEQRAREAIRQAVPDVQGRPFSDPALTPRAAEAISGALAESLKLGHQYVGTEHLLLALYRDQRGVATQVLNDLGLDAETAAARVAEALAGFASR